MAIDGDEELLQDFLVEAEEILEQLGQQLVELEKDPANVDLLNSVFRGFHTIKGGAGFLNITSLVTICHRAEDVFNLLRQGHRRVDAGLMDVILRVVDIVNGMFDDLRREEMPEETDPSIIAALVTLVTTDTPETAVVNSTQPSKKSRSATKKAVTKPARKVTAATSKSKGAASDEITDEEFEALLDKLHGKGRHNGLTKNTAKNTGKDLATSSATSVLISDEEFERLLDELHGKGKHHGVPRMGQADDESRGGYQEKTTSNENSDETSADEFEELLDKIHGDAVPGAANIQVKSEISPKVKSQPSRENGQTQTETTVRVDTRRLDEIMNLVGELVLLRNRIKSFDLISRDESLGNVVTNIDLVTSDLQASVMKSRMQPIKKVFGRFPRVVRDLARSLNKEILLELKGEETDLDKNLVEALADPLVHLVRNAVDHGIETPDIRDAAGKNRIGKIVLSAEQEGDHILLTITDDGAGMNPEKLRDIAVKKGLMDSATAQRLSNNDCYQLIFMPGFSTKTEISDISGRGVGMDVVKNRITQLNGSIIIDSEFGSGSKISIKVPLTLAIMPTLMIMVGMQIFALPLVNVVEIFNLDLSKTNVVDGQPMVIIRDKPLPIFYLNKWLVKDADDNASVSDHIGSHVVVVSIGTHFIGFVVDSLIGQEEVVIKPLGALLRGTKGIAGATVTGNGRISLILDVPGLMMAYA